MDKEKLYVCEECAFKADRLKMCCGKKMVDMKYITKCASNMCGCG